jgi:putative DNA-invertase from lambdoid prophage Rac
MAGLLAIVVACEREMLRARVNAGMAPACRPGNRHGRPPRIAHDAGDVQRRSAVGLSQSAMARPLGIGRTSVRRLLGAVVSRPHTRRGEEHT